MRARHILIRVPPDADEDAKEALRGEAARARQRILDGADFTDVALEVSQDPGSKFSGGDLGFFSRGKMVKPFEDAAFGLEPGSMSEVIESVHGFHVIRVEEKKPAELTPLEDVQEELARELVGREVAESAARTRMEALADQVRAGKSVVDAARADQLVVERPDPFRRRPDGQIPGLGVAPDVMTAAFTLSPESASLDRVFEVGDKLVLVQLLERTVPSNEDLEPEVTARRQEMLLERRNQLESSWVEARRVGLSEDGKLVYNLSALRDR